MSDTTTTQKTSQARRTGRPTLPLEQRRSERISFGVTKTQKAAFLMNAAQAGLSSNDYARTVLCSDGAHAGVWAARAPDFALIDALARLGADLERVREIAEDTGVVSPEIDAITKQLHRKLDHLIVGSRMADELATHRSALQSLSDALERKEGMTPKVRRMITTFDAVVTKVLSA